MISCPLQLHAIESDFIFVGPYGGTSCNMLNGRPGYHTVMQLAYQTKDHLSCGLGGDLYSGFLKFDYSILFR